MNTGVGEDGQTVEYWGAIVERLLVGGGNSVRVRKRDRDVRGMKVSDLFHGDNTNDDNTSSRSLGLGWREASSYLSLGMNSHSVNERKGKPRRTQHSKQGWAMARMEG